MMKKVCIILPTYNEVENVKELIPRIFSIFKINKLDGKIIVVDDNSSDGTKDVIENFQKKYSIVLINRPKKMGIGSAYTDGFNRTLNDDSEIIFEMDADLSHNPNFIPNFVKEIYKGFDVVIGSRRIEGGSVIGWNWYRKFVSFGGNSIGKYIAGIDIDDLTSGFRAYKKKVIESLDLNKIESEGYAFQLEILAKCLKKGFKISSIPIEFYDRYSGKSKLSKLDFLNFFLIALKIRFGMIK